MKPITHHHPENHMQLFAWAASRQARQLRGYRLDKWLTVQAIYEVKHG